MKSNKKNSVIILILIVLTAFFVFNKFDSYADTQQKANRQTETAKSKDGSKGISDNGMKYIDKLSKGSIGWREKGITSTKDIVIFAVSVLLIILVFTGIITYIRNYFFKIRDTNIK